MEHTSVKIIGLNGFEFFVGIESVWHNRAIEAAKMGVIVELIKANLKYYDIAKCIDKIKIYEGNINKDKIANEGQVWCLGRHIVNELKFPLMPTAGITVDMCA